MKGFSVQRARAYWTIILHQNNIHACTHGPGAVHVHLFTTQLCIHIVVALRTCRRLYWLQWMHYNTFLPLCMHANFYEYLCACVWVGEGGGAQDRKCKGWGSSLGTKATPHEPFSSHKCPRHNTVMLKREHPEAATLTLPSPSIDNLPYSSSQSVFYFVT